jgi:hypothetical protein
LHLLEKTARKGCVFGKYNLPCTLGVAMGENPSGMCHNNSVNTLSGPVLKDKDGEQRCKGGQYSVRCHNLPPQIGTQLSGAYITQGKMGNRKGREPPEGTDTLLSPY